jgi:hypothetical protein
VRFQVLTAASMMFKVFQNVAPYSHVEVDERFRVVYCIHHQGESPWWWRQCAPLKRWSTSTWLYGTAFQKTVNIISHFFLYKVMVTLAVVYELIHLISHINVYNNTLCMIVCHFGVKSALRTIMKLPHSCNFPSPGRNCITLLNATKFSRFESIIAP